MKEGNTRSGFCFHVGGLEYPLLVGTIEVAEQVKKLLESDQMGEETRDVEIAPTALMPGAVTVGDIMKVIIDGEGVEIPFKVPEDDNTIIPEGDLVKLATSFAEYAVRQLRVGNMNNAWRSLAVAKKFTKWGGGRNTVSWWKRITLFLRFGVK